MSASKHTASKILSLQPLLSRIEFWRVLGDRIVFTNGCFDLLHEGHIKLLAACRDMGERVIVGLNSDTSVKQLKGKNRPVNSQKSRAVVLASLEFVDAVIIFNEETPEKLIHAIRPNVLVKGGDWKKNEIVGSEFVESYGGSVKTVSYLKGFSTTEMIARSKK